MVPSRQRDSEKIVSAELTGGDVLRNLGFSAVFVLVLSSAVWVLAILGAIQIITSIFGAS